VRPCHCTDVFTSGSELAARSADAPQKRESREIASESTLAMNNNRETRFLPSFPPSRADSNVVRFGQDGNRPRARTRPTSRRLRVAFARAESRAQRCAKLAFNLEAAISWSRTFALRFSHAFTPSSLPTTPHHAKATGGEGGGPSALTARVPRTTHVRIDRVERALHSHACRRCWRSRDEHTA